MEAATAPKSNTPTTTKKKASAKPNHLAEIVTTQGNTIGVMQGFSTARRYVEKAIEANGLAVFTVDDRGYRVAVPHASVDHIVEVGRSERASSGDE